MKNHVLITLLVAVSSIQPAVAFRGDTILVRLSPSINSRNLVARYTIPCTPAKETSKYTGYPACNQFRIGYSIINKFQYWYSAYKAGQRDPKQFLSEIKQYAIDTNSLSELPVRSYVAVFTGLKDEHKIVIVDANNNDSFADDISYEFDTLTTEKWYRGDTLEAAPLIRVQYELVIGQKIRPAYTYIRLKPYDYAYSYPNDIDRKLAVYTVPFVHREGIFDVGDTEYKVSIMHSPKGHADDYHTPYLKLQKAGLDYNYRQEAWLSIGETWIANNQLFSIISCNRDGSILTLAYEDYQEDREGSRVNNRIPALGGNTLTGNELFINQFTKEGKYVLLDFWGSWCGPCIRTMPLLKELATQADMRKVQFVGVDYEYSAVGQQKARNYLTEHKIDWPQIAELSTDQTAQHFPVKLNVKDYPTFILIGANGRIVAREIGEDGLPKIAEQLKKLALLKHP